MCVTLGRPVTFSSELTKGLSYCPVRLGEPAAARPGVCCPLPRGSCGPMGQTVPLSGPSWKRVWP